MYSELKWIKLGSKYFQTEIMKSGSEINQGMKKYKSPPPYPMLFILKNNKGYVTMKKVKFPLDTIFFDKQFNPIPLSSGKYSIRLYPDQKDTVIPKKTYYMMEFPIGMIFPK